MAAVGSALVIHYCVEVVPVGDGSVGCKGGRGVGGVEGWGSTGCRECSDRSWRCPGGLRVGVGGVG